MWTSGHFLGIFTETPGTPVTGATSEVTVSYCKLQMFQETSISVKIACAMHECSPLHRPSPYSCCSTRSQPKPKRAFQREFLWTQLTEGSTGRKQPFPASTHLNTAWSHVFSHCQFLQLLQVSFLVASLIFAITHNPLLYLSPFSVVPSQSQQHSYFMWIPILSFWALLTRLAGWPADCTCCITTHVERMTPVLKVR